MWDSAKVVKFKLRHPRRNLPAQVSKKRGESNFALAFSRAYISSVTRGIGGAEFSLSGFGIADFVWISWRTRKNPQEAAAFSLEKIKSELLKQRLVAFEMKLTDWRKGLVQAYRYSYFADESILVLPTANALIAKENISLFQKLHVGLWGFDKKTGNIAKFFTPKSKARNPDAKEKAVNAFANLSNFGKLLK